jgi:glyoxylase-like metal-dependent hydrolase (beta-lactamase superfamily II)
MRRIAMPVTREPVRLDRNTTLIDIGDSGVWNKTGLYLIEADRRCLIDSGAKADAPRIFETLKEMGAFPPDVIIVTHSHYDHAQGIPFLRAEAAKEQKSIDVLASREAIPLLADPSYQEVFGPGPYASITDVTPLDEGDTVDLGSTKLSIYDVPGHVKDHIAILDEGTGNIFVGDSIGAKFGDNAFVPLFFAPFWDSEAFYASVSKLRQIDYETLCLAHFGPVRGDEAKAILDRAIVAYEQWWRVLEENEDRLDETGYLLDEILEKTGLALPPIETVSPVLGFVLGLMTAWNKLIHGKSWSVSKLFLPEVVEWQVEGYRTCKGQ